MFQDNYATTRSSSCHPSRSISDILQLCKLPVTKSCHKRPKKIIEQQFHSSRTQNEMKRIQSSNQPISKFYVNHHQSQSVHLLNKIEENNNQIYLTNPLKHDLDQLAYIDKSLIQTLESNHILLERQNIILQQDTLTQIILDIFSQIQSIIQSSSNLKDKINQCLEILNSSISNILFQLCKQSSATAVLCEGLWKIFIHIVNMFFQKNQMDLDFQRNIYFKQIEEELNQKIKQNQKLNDEIFSMKQLYQYEIYKLNQQILLQQAQLKLQKAEFEDFKHQQQEVGSLEYATGAMEQLGIKLKDMTYQLKYFDEEIGNRDLKIQDTVRTLVRYCKNLKYENTEEPIYKGLQSLNKNERHFFADIYFKHPFLYYLVESQPQISDVEQYLIEWFNQITPNDMSASEMFLTYIYSKTQDINVVQCHIKQIVDYINGVCEQNEDLEKQCKEAILFAHFFGIANREVVTMPLFWEIVEIYQKLKIIKKKTIRIKIDSNKLRWFTREVQNLKEIINNPEVLEASATVNDVFLRYIYAKQKSQNEQLNTSLKLIEQQVHSHFKKQRKDIQGDEIVIEQLKHLMELTEWGVVRQAIKSNHEWCKLVIKRQNQLEQEWNEDQWIYFLQDSLKKVWNIYKLFPQSFIWKCMRQLANYNQQSIENPQSKFNEDRSQSVISETVLNQSKSATLIDNIQRTMILKKMAKNLRKQ